MKVCSLVKWLLFETTEQLMLRDMDTGRFYIVDLLNIPSWELPHNSGALQVLRIQLSTRPYKRGLLEQNSFSFAGSALQSVHYGARFRYAARHSCSSSWPAQHSKHAYRPTPCVNCCCVLLADAVIVNFDTSIGQLFQQYGPSKDILFSKDYGGNSIINAGNPCCQVVPAL